MKRQIYLLLTVLLTVSCSFLTMGCGKEKSSSKKGEWSKFPAPTFPQTQGTSAIFDLTRGLTEEGALASSTGVMDVGENRFGFAIFSKDNKQLDLPAVAVYIAEQDGTQPRGPYIAKRESVAVKPQYESRQTASDLQRGDKFYTARIPFKKAGVFVVFAIAQNQNGDMIAVSGSKVSVGSYKGNQPPREGDKAIAVRTPTVDSVGGAVEKIDTRIPPIPEMHKDNLAKLIGRKPVVLLFATPQLCQSRVCGPVVDIAQQVKSETQTSVPFIHMEIYKDNKVASGFRPEVKAWRLPSEPWLFAIDKHGIVKTRIEGAFSVEELEKVVKQLEKAK